jgi:Zn-dependent protease/CBS domain-containing protein
VSATQGDSPDRRVSGGIRIGRVFGIPIFVSPSWFLIALVLTALYAPVVANRLPTIGNVKYVISLFFVVLLYLSVLIHELSHAVIALRFGLPVRQISLYLLGGLAEIDRQPETPGREFAVAAAGPAVSLLIGGCGYAVGGILTEESILRVLVSELTIANFLVGFFNLLPGLPLDGGRLLQAGVWKLSGRPLTGTVVAAWVGRGVAVLLVGLAVVNAVLSEAGVDAVSLIWSIMISSFIWAGASQALTSATIRSRLPSLDVRALARIALPLLASTPVAEAVRQATEIGAHALIVVDTAGTPVGVVSEAALAAIPEGRRPWVPLSSVAKGVSADVTIQVDISGEELLQVIRHRPASEYLVTEPNGEVFGVLAAADVHRLLAPT